MTPGVFNWASAEPCGGSSARYRRLSASQEVPTLLFSGVGVGGGPGKAGVVSLEWPGRSSGHLGSDRPSVPPSPSPALLSRLPTWCRTLSLVLGG